MPHIPAAGKVGQTKPWITQPDIILPSPRTPEGRPEMLTKHKRRTDAGERAVHWGLKDLAPPDPGDGYGVRSNKGETVLANFLAGQVTGIAEYVQNRGASVYYTSKREPLGSGYNRGHVLPEETKQPSFKGFGKEEVLDEVPAKEMIFPRDVLPETDVAKSRYKMTHGSFDPGEPINRKYVWPKTIADDPHFRFGRTEQGPVGVTSGSGAKTALTMEAEADGSFPVTRVVTRSAETYRRVFNDQLGKGRNMMQGPMPVAPGHAFGLPTGRDKTHAGELVRGFYSPRDQLPEPDLGVCTVVGKRNFQTKRPFGLGSVRRDRVPPPLHKRSLANSYNYGDDQSAFELLYPEKFSAQGVTNADFSDRRSADDIKDILVCAGYRVEPQDFDMLWDASLQFMVNFVVGNSDEQTVPVEVFMQYLTDWLSQSGNMTARGERPNRTLAAPASARGRGSRPPLAPTGDAEETMAPPMSARF